MHTALTKNLFVVKEHLGVFKAANNYDVFDPESGALLMECREDRLGWLTKLLRFTDYKRNTPFDVQVRDPQGRQIVRVSRGISLLLSKVDVFDEADLRVGGFAQKLFSIGGAFEVQDASGMVVCTLQGKWTGWDFRFTRDGRELAHVTKKWSGLGKELFTSADNYVLQIDAGVAGDDPVRELILAAVLCIDMVLKE